MKLFPAQAFTCIATKLLGSGVASRAFWARALRNGRHGDGTVAVALLATRSTRPRGPQVDEFSSDKSHFLEGRRVIV
jgi:hypothetical protein